MANAPRRGPRCRCCSTATCLWWAIRCRGGAEQDAGPRGLPSRSGRSADSVCCGAPSFLRIACSANAAWRREDTREGQQWTLTGRLGACCPRHSVPCPDLAVETASRFNHVLVRHLLLGLVAAAADHWHLPDRLRCSAVRDQPVAQCPDVHRRRRCAGDPAPEAVDVRAVRTAAILRFELLQYSLCTRSNQEFANATGAL